MHFFPLFCIFVLLFFSPMTLHAAEPLPPDILSLLQQDYVPELQVHAISRFSGNQSSLSMQQVLFSPRTAASSTAIEQAVQNLSGHSQYLTSIPGMFIRPEEALTHTLPLHKTMEFHGIQQIQQLISSTSTSLDQITSHHLLLNLRMEEIVQEMDTTRLRIVERAQVTADQVRRIHYGNLPVKEFVLFHGFFASAITLIHHFFPSST